jgi:hypothetical protein
LLETSRVRSCRGRVATQPTTQVSACPSPAHRPAQSGAAADDEGVGAVLMDDGMRASMPTAPCRRFPNGRVTGVRRRAAPLHHAAPNEHGVGSYARRRSAQDQVKCTLFRRARPTHRQEARGGRGFVDDFVSLAGACKSGLVRQEEEL